jgi:DNA-binding transcriptional MocR family regulator
VTTLYHCSITLMPRTGLAEGVETGGPLWLARGTSDVEASQQCASQGIDVLPLSVCCVEKIRKRGLLLGYAAFDERAIVDSVQRMAVALQRRDRTHSRQPIAALVGM